MITREIERKGAVLVTFTLVADAPVSVVGDFNGWDPHVHPLGQHADGKRAATVELFPGRYAFRYLADGGRFFDDPEADYLESNGMGDSHGILEIPVVEAAPDTRTVAAPTPPKPTKAKAPKAKTPPRDDDLERVEGVGPKIADALRAGGITTFADLADAPDERLRDALGAAKLRFAPSLGTWAEQARLLAKGDDAGFEALIAQLTAGRPPKAKGTKAKSKKD
jgi:predicted flap endonuclease-1-like 5' DNA nuclease